MKFIALFAILLIGAAYCDSSSESDSNSGSGSSEKQHKHLKKYKSRNDCEKNDDCDYRLSSSGNTNDQRLVDGPKTTNKYDSKRGRYNKYISSSEEHYKSRRKNKSGSGSDGSNSSDDSGSNSSSGEHKRKKHKEKKYNRNSRSSKSGSDSGSSSGSSESREKYNKGRKRPNENKRYKPKVHINLPVYPTEDYERSPKPFIGISDDVRPVPFNGGKSTNEHKPYQPSSEENIFKNKEIPKYDKDFNSLEGDKPKKPQMNVFSTPKPVNGITRPIYDESDDVSQDPFNGRKPINEHKPSSEENIFKNKEISKPKKPQKNVFSSISSEEDNDQCLREVITTKDGTKIEFPQANNGALIEGYQIKEILSDPICLDEYNFPITRKCVYDVWENISTPECFSYRKKLENICPPGFSNFKLEEKSYCLSVLSSQKWNNSCMQFGDNIIDLELFQKESFFNHHKIKKFWLPGKRDGPKDQFISKTLSSFGDNLNIEHIAINGDCLVFDYIHRKVASEDCDKKYPMICLQDHSNNQLIKLACPDGYLTTTLIGYQNQCFRISAEINNYNVFEVTSPEKEYILKSIVQPTNDLKIAINILPNNHMKKPQIFESNQNLTFSNWIESYKFDDVKKFVVTVFKGDGWILSEKYDLVANEIELKMQKPEMYLNFQFEKKSLYVTVNSGNFIWKSNDDETGIQCFTNSDGNIIKKIGINIKSVVRDYFRTLSIYEVDLIHTNPGEYWCHAHSISNFEFIKTDKVIAYRDSNDLIFVALIEKKCGVCTQVTENHFINNVTNSIQTIIGKTVRIMKIDSINFEESTVRYVLHISTSHHDLSTKQINHAYKKGISIKTYEIYLLRKDLLKKLNKLTDYTLYSLTSSNWCFSEEEKYNVIQTIDDEKSQEICKSSQYSPTKECITDFMYGGIWKDIVCSLNKRDITQDLNGLRISYFQPSHKIRKLLEIISKDVKIKTTDLYIISDILKSIKVTELKKTDIKNVVKIINELMLIEKMDDLKYNTANIILDTFDNIIKELDSYHMKTPKVEIFTINENSGVLGVAIFKNTSKHILNNDFSDYYFEYLYSNEQIELLLLEDNFEVAAIIPSELLTIMNENNKISTAPLKIVISIFYDNLLFPTNEIEEKHKSSGIILKLSIPGYNSDSIKQLYQRISVYFKIHDDLKNKKLSCGFWNFEDWSTDELIYVSDSNVTKCEYSSIKYFSILSAEQILEYDVRTDMYSNTENKGAVIFE